MAAGDKLWLFWRGGNWYPTFSYTRDGREWVRARTLVRGPHEQRPYAKYAGGPDGSIHMLFSDGHPHSYRTSLYYLRYRAGRFHDASGKVIGRMRDLPLRTRRMKPIYRYRAGDGRAWPHDVALEADGTPVAAYTRRTGGPGGTDTYFYARWDGARWRHHRIVGAGAGAKTFNSGGITFQHARPSWVVLSRTVGQWNEVELWRTPDGGASWLAPFPITTRSEAHNIRPIIPRERAVGPSLIVFYVHGTADSFRNFRTVVRMAVPQPDGASPDANPP